MALNYAVALFWSDETKRKLMSKRRQIFNLLYLIGFAAILHLIWYRRHEAQKQVESCPVSAWFFFLEENSSVLLHVYAECYPSVGMRHRHRLHAVYVTWNEANILELSISLLISASWFGLVVTPLDYAPWNFHRISFDWIKEACPPARANLQGALQSTLNAACKELWKPISGQFWRLYPLACPVLEVANALVIQCTVELVHLHGLTWYKAPICIHIDLIRYQHIW